MVVISSCRKDSGTQALWAERSWVQALESRGEVIAVGDQNFMELAGDQGDVVGASVVVEPELA